MGIDIYLNWKGKTDADQQAQYTGFSVTGGAVGYLREAYHGGPYVTRYLVQEAFEDDEVRLAWENAHPEGSPDEHKYNGPQIPAATLRQRLPAAVCMAMIREHLIYGDGDKPWELGAIRPDPEPERDGMGNRLDGEGEQPPTPEPAEAAVMADPQVRKKLGDIFAGIEIMKGGGDEKVMAKSFPPELLALAEMRIKERALPDYALAFVEFVELAERKEQETGAPVTVYASY